MNSLVEKEIRLLLPAYGMALLLAVAPVWVLPADGHNSSAAVALFPFSFGAVMLALSTFGREFGLKTFPLMLAQPLERTRIWRTKIAVLAAAMATIWGAWFLACTARVHEGLGHQDGLEIAAIGGTVVLVTLAGGLWTTLLLRQVTAAFWFTILVPAMTAMVIGTNGGSELVVFTALGLYSVVGFLWARSEFLRVQEAAWTGGDISFPGWRAAETVARSAARVRRPLAALFWKELQLHQIGLAGMACLFLLHLGVVLLRKQDLADSVRKGLEVFGGIWLLVPLLVGAQSVAEERKLGTWADHLCLPVSSRVQFAVKLFFVLIIGGLLSPVLLRTVEAIGTAMGAGSGVGMFGSTSGHIVVFCSLSLIGFYASTLARSLVQALAIAVFTIIGLGVLGEIFANPVEILGVRVWRGRLINYVAWPTLVMTFLWLTQRNFRRASESWGMWRRNALALAAALAGIVAVTTTVYHRAWELVTSIERTHGPARLTREQPPRLSANGGSSALAVVLPDGSLWVDHIAYLPGRIFLSFGEESGIHRGGKWIGLSGHPIIAGSNWVDAAAGLTETVGIRADGTLWVSEKRRRSWDGQSQPPIEEADRLVQVGTHTNWQRVLRQDYSMTSLVLLKADGTLWHWGTNSFKQWTGLRAFEPYHLDEDSDWAEAASSVFNVYVWKRDRTAWVINPRVAGTSNHPVKEITGIERVRSLDHTKWRSLGGGWMWWQAGVREDGTLWIWNSVFQAAPGIGQGLTTELVQIGKDNDWLSVASAYRFLAALRADGTLWVWSLEDLHRQGIIKFTFQPGANVETGIQANPVAASKSPRRLGRHDDWVAVSGALGGIVSLAADGSLWYWWGRDEDDYQNSDQPMLAPSRRPDKIGNIFSSR
jgi:hypothetical protein